MTEQSKFFRCRRCGNLVGLIEKCRSSLGVLRRAYERIRSEYGGGRAGEACAGGNQKGRPNPGFCRWYSPPDGRKAFHPMGISADETGRTEKRASAGTKPEAVFCVIDDEPMAVFAYCNQHGLWKTELSRQQAWWKSFLLMREWRFIAAKTELFKKRKPALVILKKRWLHKKQLIKTFWPKKLVRL